MQISAELKFTKYFEKVFEPYNFVVDLEMVTPGIIYSIDFQRSILDSAQTKIFFYESPY